MKFSTNPQSVGQVVASLRDARKAQHITQAELAEATGLTRPWISQFEQGKIPNAGLSRILAICHALNVNLTISYDVDADDSDESAKDGQANRSMIANPRTPLVGKSVAQPLAEHMAKSINESVAKTIAEPIAKMQQSLVNAAVSNLDQAIAHSQNRYQQMLNALMLRSEEVQHGSED
ncbi:helix-turn-helix domain-containing protein [Bifidobacterium bombi]|uniref:Transcriptional regulator, XRE family n=1 Tax=Bifidobacterium bombi DSM 19703 TaxID=1341695 RepID=A0A086BPC0_9BIFI|nr:helix-turn-helix domain-containing protein [Bifidobacterium bombi]KFF31784.1 transcriptional regulator, XRE family [Bifidobacterium bombi DSM 19703]